MDVLDVVDVFGVVNVLRVMVSVSWMRTEGRTGGRADGRTDGGSAPWSQTPPRILQTSMKRIRAAHVLLLLLFT